MWRAQAVQATVVAVVTVLAVAREANIAVLGVADLLPKANGSQQISLTVGEPFLGPPAGSPLPCVPPNDPWSHSRRSSLRFHRLARRLPCA
jgi:hypothetical protein